MPKLFTFLTLIFIKIICFSITAEVMMDDVRSNPVTKFENKAIEAVNKESERLKRSLSEVEVDKLTKDLIKDDLLKAKISSVIVASIFSQDPNVALLTGSNALDNNCWHLLLPAVTGALRISAIYEYYNIWKNEGEEGLLKHLALNKMIGVVSSKSLGVVWKIGEKTFTNSKLALQAFLNNNPIIAQRLYKFSQPIAQGVGNVKSQIGNFFNHNWQQEVEKVKFTKAKVGKSTEAEHLLNKPSKPTLNVKDAEGVSRPSTLVTADSFSKNSKIIPLEKSGRVMFDGVEFRAVRNLRHLDDKALLRMHKNGTNPKDINGIRLDGHHHKQQYHREQEAFIVEIIEPKHCISNKIQHPLGISGGLSKIERQDWNKLRTAFNKERAKEELIKRGLLNE